MNINNYIQKKTQMVNQLHIAPESVPILCTLNWAMVRTLAHCATGRTDICLMLFCFMLLENHYEKDFDCSVISLLHFRLYILRSQTCRAMCVNIIK